MSDLYIDVANYMVEQDDSLTFEKAQQMIFDMSEKDLNKLMNKVINND